MIYNKYQKKKSLPNFNCHFCLNFKKNGTDIDGNSMDVLLDHLANKFYKFNSAHERSKKW